MPHSLTASLVSTMLLALLLTSACHSAPSGPVIAEIGGEPVTVDQFYRHLEQLNPLMKYPELPATEQDRLLRDYLAQRLHADAARREGLDEQADVAARLEYFTQRILAEAYRERMAGAYEPAEDDVRAYYQDNKPLFSVPAQYLIEHLVYRESGKAVYARDQLVEGRPWLELAGHRETDSDLTFVERNRFSADLLLPELRGPVSKLEEGQVTDLIYTNYGYHVIRLVEKQDATIRPLEEVRAEIAARLKQSATARQLESIVDEQRAQGRIRVHLDQLRKDAAL